MGRAAVTVRPSGHRFKVKGCESLLEAGLRAGLNLDYGCGDGRCGLCKARVVGGTVVPLRAAADAPLSAIEREQGYALLCTHTASTEELTILALEAAGPADLPRQDIEAVVRALAPVAPDTLQLHLALPTHRRLRFLAGQSVTLAIEGGKAGASATYPVASCPCDDRNLHFYLARDASDPFVECIFTGGLSVGDRVRVCGPEGRFVLGDAQGQLVFVACDAAIAPIRSMIEHAIAIDEAESLSLYWLATRPGGHFLADQCRAWDEALDHFDFSLHRDADLHRGARQVVEAIRVDRFPMRCDVYLAGPEAFVGTVATQLRAGGLPAAQIATTVVD